MQRTPKSINVGFAPKATVKFMKMRSAALSQTPTLIFVGHALVGGFDGKHVVSRQGTADTLERELTHRLDCHGILDCH
jgi:hypothetical protein